MHRCRLCDSALKYTFADLGRSPLSNAYLSDPSAAEKIFPLHAYVCENCFLVQLPSFTTPEDIFSDYAYFSSYSQTWLDHAKRYASDITSRLRLNGESQVIEIASNDGYLLKYFKAAKIPVLGIEPAANVAEQAKQDGIPTRIAFFGLDFAKTLGSEGLQADLLIGNNVLAHVPDLNDFVAGLKALLKPAGTITLEFPHLLSLIEESQFDTIYHEHFSYFSLRTVQAALKKHGLIVYDVEQLSTHGGSLRIYATHDANADFIVAKNIQSISEMELNAGLGELAVYLEFSKKPEGVKTALMDFLVRAAHAGKKVVGYGAPAKGNTLLNYCGIGADFIEYTVDRSPHKQGLFLPGSHIPIRSPEYLKISKPDYVLILPWNIKDEIIDQVGYIRKWGGKFVVPIPHPEVLA